MWSVREEERGAVVGSCGCCMGGRGHAAGKLLVRKRASPRAAPATLAQA